MRERTATREAISGRAVGVMFFAGFGSLWLAAAFAAMHNLHPASLLAIAVIFASLMVPAIQLLRKIPSNTEPGARRQDDLQVRRTFHRVNGMQWAAIIGAVVLLNVFHQTVYMVPVIAAIVGLHLFPLAGLFRYNPHYVTGTLLVAWSIVSVTRFRPEKIASFGALGTAVILLASAAYTLILAMRSLRLLLPALSK